MKTNEELEVMANKVRDLCSSGISSNIDSAIQILNDLHSEGMMDAVEIIRNHPDTDTPASDFSEAIISASDSKLKP